MEVIEVLNNTEVVAPKLRFNGFADEWIEKKLGEVGNIRMCKRVFSYETSDRGDIPFYKIGTFGRVADAYIKKELYLKYKEHFAFPKTGEILMSASGTLGRTVVYDGSPAYFQDSNIVWIENDEKLITNSFLYYIYQIVKYDSEGGTIRRLYNNIIKSARFYKPSLPEQQKIATFLSAVDEKIQLLKRKKELLEQYKKGVMQQLFSGKLRFKDENGEDYPDWEEKKLEEVAIKIQDGTHFSPKTMIDGDFLYLTSKNVKNGFIDLSSSEKISEEEHSAIYKRCDVKRGDILLTKDGTIGQVCVNELDEQFSLLSSVAFIRTKPDFDNYFLYQSLVSPFGQAEISSKIAGQALKRITLTKIKNFKFLFPVLGEQQKIGQFLSSIDLKLSYTSNQITLTQTFKKGLLQQMFV